MKAFPIAIVGAGGFGKEVLELIEQINQVNHKWKIVGFYDDRYEKGLKVNDYHVLGNLNDLNSLSENVSITIAVGDSKTRYEIKTKLSNPLLSYSYSSIRYYG
jgi:predicted dinucleotide-utilizing enzyme